MVDPTATFLIATENGYGKRCDFNDFTPHNRGGQGMIAIKDDSGRNGKVVAAFAVQDGQSMISITSNGLMVRSPIIDIRLCGRAAQGVRLVRLDEGAKVVSVSIADPEEAPRTITAAPESSGAPDTVAPQEAPEQPEVSETPETPENPEAPNA